jgi:diguanylate cyclase (GGDEF)-like protein
MRVSTEAKVVAGFSLALLLMFGLGVATYLLTRDLLRENERVTLTYEVIQSLDAVLASMTDAQTAQRGYLITGDERFLDPYQTALPRLQESVKRAAHLTADNADQLRRVEELRRRVERNLDVINEVIMLRRRGDERAAADVVKSGRGKVEMDAIRRIIGEMKREEARLLAERTEGAARAARRVTTAFFTLTLAISLLLLLSYNLVRRDVARRKLKESALRRRAHTDSLTGLYNREGFEELGRERVKLARTAGVDDLLFVFVDVDGLKEVNDRYNHKSGDRLILAAAAALRRTFRDTDIIARLGGDEFAALVLDVGRMGGEFFKVRLREAIRESNEKTREPFKLSLSIGVATLGEAAVPTLESALAAADERMYWEKKSRTGREVRGGQLGAEGRAEKAKWVDAEKSGSSHR